MKKRIAITLTTIAIITFGIFMYAGYLTDANKQTDSMMINKNGEVIEPLSDANDEMGH